MYQLRHSNSWRSGRKGRTEKLVKKGSIFLLCNGRWQNFHIDEKKEISIVNKKFKIFDLNETVHHVIVNGADWSNPLIFLTY